MPRFTTGLSSPQNQAQGLHPPGFLGTKQTDNHIPCDVRFQGTQAWLQTPLRCGVIEAHDLPSDGFCSCGLVVPAG